MKKIIGCVVLCVLLLAAPVCAAPLFESTLGVNHHFTQQPEPDLKDIGSTREAGFRMIRYDMTWDGAERQKGVYDFQPYDRLLAQMTAKGIRPLFILDYGNPLYGDARAVRTAEGREAYARFAGAAAKRYKGKGVIWEIWNEPNMEAFWSPGPDVYEYMELVIETAAAIRSADPASYVIAPGVARIDFPFLENCMKLGLLRYVDAISVHPYRDEKPESSLVDLLRLQDLLVKYSPDKAVPIVVSEWGYSASAFGGDEQMQARYLTRMFLLNAYAGIDFTIWYDFRNDGKEPRNYEHNFGLFRQDGTPKPALEEVRTMAQQLSGRRFSRRIFSRAEDFVLEFVDMKGKLCFAAWTVGDNHAVRVPDQGIVVLTQKPQFQGCR